MPPLVTFCLFSFVPADPDGSRKPSVYQERFLILSSLERPSSMVSRVSSFLEDLQPRENSDSVSAGPEECWSV